MDRKLNFLKRPARSTGAAISDARLEAWAATERDPEMREVLHAYARGSPVTSGDDKPRDLYRDPRAVLWIYVPTFVWFHEALGSSRLLDAPAGYLGTLYHQVPHMVLIVLLIGLLLLSGWAAGAYQKDTDGRRWPAVVLACYVLLTYWQLVPPAFTRWFGTPHAEIAQVKESLVRSTKSSIVPTRLVVARPGGAVESIDYHITPFAEHFLGANERRLGLKTEAGHWVRLSGERSALGFLVHHIARADPPP